MKYRAAETSDVRALKPKKRSKMRNRRCVSDGISFDSEKEAARWTLLRIMQERGEICALQRQCTFVLGTYDENGHFQEFKSHTGRKMTYDADFAYNKNGREIYEDVKPSYKTRKAEKRYKATDQYRRFWLKKCIVEAAYSVIINEV